MSNRVLIKRGLSTNLNNAGVVAGELKYATDTNKLYIGNGTENIEIGGCKIVEIDSSDNLPELNESNAHKLFYCKEDKTYYFIKEVNGQYSFSAYSCYKSETLNPTVSSNYQYVSSEDKYYKATYDMDGYPYVTVTTKTPENPTQYENETYVVCRGSSKLYQIDVKEEVGYKEISNFKYSYYTSLNPSIAIVGSFFYYRGYDQIYYIKSVNWEEFTPLIFDKLPTPAKKYLNKIVYSSGLIYLCNENVAGVLAWEELKTDVDFEKLKREVQNMLSTRLEVEEYQYMQPEACAEAMGKLFVWKEQGYYQICVKGSTDVVTVATVTKEETTSSGSSSSSGSSGDGEEIVIDIDPIGANEEPYMEGLLADRPDAGFGSCNCYYATNVNKYFIRMATTGGFLSYYWAEVEMHIQSYKPSSSSAEGYYKVVSGNTTTIYRVVTYYSWVNIVEDQHPNVSAQKVAGTWGYDMFRLTNFMFDYEEKDISSMNTGYIYGVIEDA